MRGKNRKPIASCLKLPQFTTMNVIDGQAGLILYASLIFCSLTIDNILNIIVLLILAGVSIATLTGENGILTKAQNATDLTNRKTAEEEIQIEILGSLDNGADINLEKLNDNLINNLTGVKYKGEPLSKTNKIESLPAVVEYNNYEILISGDTSVALEDALEPGEEAKETKKYNYTDGVDVATIPEGFAVSEKEDEQKIENGLVIKNVKDGNEFVWIPCTLDEYKKAKNMVMTEKWSRNKEYETNEGGEDDGTKWRDDYTPEDLKKINNAYGEEATETISKITESWENYQTTVAEESIGKYEGFYIARYEAGIPEEAPFYTSPDAENLNYNRSNRGATTKAGLDIIKNLAPVSKKGVQAWNLISQPNAKIVAENMYKTSDEVGSYLVDSQAWNHICKNIFKAQQGQTANNSTSWGNYHNNSSAYNKEIEGLWAQHAWTTKWEYATKYKKGTVIAKAGGDSNTELGGANEIELPTGASDDFKNYNIYDMAGNMYEWTTEHNIDLGNKNMFAISRGR